MIPRIFFAIVYLPRFPGYIGYRKRGITIASFDQWGSFWDVTCNLDFMYILSRQNMVTWKRVLDPVAEPLWIYRVWLILPRSKKRLIFQLNKR